MTKRSIQLNKAIRHLKTCDDVMPQLIATAGPCTIRTDRNRFRMLVRSIIGQQLSTHAARTIRKRLDVLLQSTDYQPEKMIVSTLEDLQEIGISRQKGAYILGLTRAILDKQLQLSNIGRFKDETIITQLTQIRGIGRWTAHMFLIFSLGRLDVFPDGDLGINNSIRKHYHLVSKPDRQTMEQIARPWQPFRSIGAWYCWRSLDFQLETVTK
ncbi:MAG: DNA-3-methyladenine glycosylase 2 family protein [Planctomycetota bacterium]|nr:DNA-3-methyladenine glycosylase 2 family protein [Planctomycetota bacterium]